ncbi:hypothetical protein FHT87_005927 [Rhizobium sp. BK316]|nr:hypothetical protein [Rhizobium sp. BK316]
MNLIGVNSGKKFPKLLLLIVERNPRLTKKGPVMVDKPFLRHNFRASLRKNRLGTTSARWGAKNLGEKR